MNYQLQINESFYTYNRKMDKVYQELNSLKESYSGKEYSLLLEGFWDKVKSFTNSTGQAIGNAKNAVSGAVSSIQKLGSDVYDKGMELGRKALEIGKELVNKISNAINTGIETIKKAPGQLWDNVVALSTSVGAEIAEVYKKAKEKGGEWIQSAKDTAIQIYTKMALGLSTAYKSVSAWAVNNKEEFKKSLQQKSSELAEAAESAKKSAFEGLKSIGEGMLAMMDKIKDGTIDVAKYTGKLVLGLVALPFIATYMMVKKTYEIGEDLVDAMKTGIQTLKTNLGEAWTSGVEGYNSTQEPVKEGRVVKSFRNFKI